MSREAPDIDRFLEVRLARAPRFSHDGERVVLLSDLPGVAHVFSAEAAGGPLEQHTAGAEPIALLACARAADRWVFATDRGGNERFGLYLLTDRGRTERPITSAPDVIHHYGGMTADGERIAWAANARDRAIFDLHVAELGGEEVEPRRVLQSDGWWLAAGFSPDGASLLASERRGLMDADLHLIDLVSGARRPLTAVEGAPPARHEVARFVQGGAALLMLSDRDDDHLRLCRLDLESGRREVLDAGGADVEHLSARPDAPHAIYARNVDGASELVLRELASGRERPLEGLPRGVLIGLSLGPRGERAAVAVSSHAVPGDVWVVDLPDGEPRRLTTSPRAGIPDAALTEARSERFESFDGRTVPVFIYEPVERLPGGPCVVYVHGGPESQFRPAWNPVVQFLAANGFTVCAPNVRGSTGYGKAFTALDDVERRPDSVEDLAACARWLRGRGHERLAVMGGSYGGYMVLSTITAHPELWAAAVDVVGIANLVTFLENTGPWRRKLREREYGSLQTDRELLRRLSPIHRVHRIACPLMVVHGANDSRVPVSEAEQIVEAVRARGGAVEYRCYDDEGHGIAKRANRIDCYRAVVRFLREHLVKGGQ